MSLYPEDGPIPGIGEHIIEDHSLDTDFIFAEEMVGFSEHPVMTFTNDSTDYTGEETIMVEKMGVSDPESDKLTGQSFVVSAIQNLLPKDAKETHPDLVIHHSG
jgi:hypothetical protein